MGKMYITKALKAAYRDANYCAPMPNKNILLRVGEASKDIQELMASAQAEGAVLITAHNPFGADLSETKNTEANARLQSDLECHFPKVLSGYGASQDEKYREESFLAFPVSRAEAIELCCQYQQNAVLFIGLDGVPELVFHPEV